mgnify:CR=1 FL=1
MELKENNKLKKVNLNIFLIKLFGGKNENNNP